MNSSEIINFLKQEDNPSKKLELLNDLLDKDIIELIDPLIELLENEENRAVKERIFLLLNRLVPLNSFKNIERMLRSADPFVRNAGVEIIKKNEIPLINFFISLAEDPDRDVRKFVIDALSAEKNPDSVLIMRRRLHDSDINIVYTAMEYLGNFADRGSAEEIEQILFNSDNMMVICSALEALAKIGYSPQSASIKEKFISENNPLFTFSFLKYLKSFGTPEDLAFIEKLIQEKGEILTKEIIDALEGILVNNALDRFPESLILELNLLQEKTNNEVNKYAISKLLARSDRWHALENARKTLLQEECDDMLRLSAIEILKSLGTTEDVSLLENLVKVVESDELLEAIGDAVEEILKRTGKEEE